MNNQELNSRTTEESTRSCGRRNQPYGYAFNALSKIWLALAVGFLLIPGVARAQQYVFENISFPGDTFTQLLGINDCRRDRRLSRTAINSGIHSDSGRAERVHSGEFSGLDLNAGHRDQQCRQHGRILYRQRRNLTTVSSRSMAFSRPSIFRDTTFDQILGLNNKGQAAGYFMTGNQQTAFIFNPFLPPGGQFTPLSLPGSGQATGINDKGQVSGFFATGATSDDGFLLSAGKLTILSFPGATVTEALGLNNLGQVVGFYNDAMPVTRTDLSIVTECSRRSMTPGRPRPPSTALTTSVKLLGSPWNRMETQSDSSAPRWLYPNLLSLVC